MKMLSKGKCGNLGCSAVNYRPFFIFLLTLLFNQRSLNLTLEIRFLMTFLPGRHLGALGRLCFQAILGKTLHPLQVFLFCVVLFCFRRSCSESCPEVIYQQLIYGLISSESATLLLWWRFITGSLHSAHRARAELPFHPIVSTSLFRARE